MENNGTGTAVFNAQILNTRDEVLLDTRNVIVGILNPGDIRALRKQFGGQQGVGENRSNVMQSDLRIPLFDNDMGSVNTRGVISREATQVINPELWPLQFHFRGDPVVPGNFGTHGMIALLKASAKSDFGLKNPIFKSMTKKSFSGMIFEDEKQIRFTLDDISLNDSGDVVAANAALYLEDIEGQRLIDTPIYTFKNLTVTDVA